MGGGHDGVNLCVDDDDEEEASSSTQTLTLQTSILLRLEHKHRLKDGQEVDWISTTTLMQWFSNWEQCVTQLHSG